MGDDALKMVRGSVHSRSTGEERECEAARCGCGGEAFLIYFIGHQTREEPFRGLHFQCADCDATYCAHQGECLVQ